MESNLSKKRKEYSRKIRDLFSNILFTLSSNQSYVFILSLASKKEIEEYIQLENWSRLDFIENLSKSFPNDVENKASEILENLDSKDKMEKLFNVLEFLGNVLIFSFDSQYLYEKFLYEKDQILDMVQESFAKNILDFETVIHALEKAGWPDLDDFVEKVYSGFEKNDFKNFPKVILELKAFEQGISGFSVDTLKALFSEK